MQIVGTFFVFFVLVMAFDKLWNNDTFWFGITLCLIVYAGVEKLAGQWTWLSWVQLILGLIGVPLFGGRLWRARRS
jgi:hypothetical protein